MAGRYNRPHRSEPMISPTRPLRERASSTSGLRLLAFALVVPIVTTGAALQTTPPVAPGATTASERSRKVDELFRQWHSPDSPGAAVLIIEKGRIAHAKGYG